MKIIRLTLYKKKNNRYLSFIYLPAEDIALVTQCNGYSRVDLKDNRSILVNERASHIAIHWEVALKS